MKDFYRKCAVAAMLGSMFVLGLIGGYVRAEFYLAAADAKSLLSYSGGTVEVVGKVDDDPDRRDTSLRVTVRAQKVGNRELPPMRQGKFIAILPRDADVSYGDTLTLRGLLTEPQAFETNTGHIFDYPNYLRVKNISALMPQASVEKRIAGGYTLLGMLFSIKHAFESSVEHLFVEPENSLLEGILLGERRGMSQDLMQSFIISGLVHVVVLSGYNISIVSEWVMRAFSFLPRVLGLSFGGVVIILFAMMTGAGATSIRACIMALVAILARYLRRPTVALRSLIFAALIMILWNPLSMLYDPSFILSVLATFGLITISPWAEKKLAWVPEEFGVRSIAASTLSVQFFVLPALLYFTGVLSFVSLPANILALPVVSFAMLMGFIAGILGFIHPLLAFLPALIADMLLRWMILVARTASMLPFSSTIVTSFPACIAAATYIPLTAIAVWLYQKTSEVD